MFGKTRIPRHCLLERPRSRRPWGMWLTMTMGLVVLTVLAIGLAEASERHPSSYSTGDVDSGRMTLRIISEQSQPAEVDAPLLDTQVKMTINGMVASVTYVQTFHNPSNTWIEGRYLFPLPETAAIHAMTMRIGERLIVGDIKEKQAARDIYQKAKQAGQRTSLIEQQRPNMFTQRVANIGPGESIEVALSYRQTVGYQHGRFQLRLPLTITPRYIPGRTLTTATTDPLITGDGKIPSRQSDTLGWGWSYNTDQVADADQITPPMISSKGHRNGDPRNPVSLDIDLDAGMPLANIDSPYHNIVIAKQGQRHHITLSQGREPMDRDFVLSWQPVARQTPKAALFRENVAGEEYLLLMVMPPAARSTEVLPREVTYIVDTSGSMAGTSIEQAKASLQLALSNLSDRDRFNIVAFNSGFHQYAPQSQPASAQLLQSARHYVTGLQAGGGTEMFAPLQAVLNTPASPGYLKQVIFITDGSVGNERALFQLIEQHLGSARLFMVGIGSAPNSFFMRKSAQFGRGSFTHIGDLGEVSEKMSNLFRQLEAPVLRDIQLQWPDAVQAEVYPGRLPDLYHGQPLLLKAKVNKIASGNLTLSGQTPTGVWQQSLALQPMAAPFSSASASASGIASLWARDKIAALMDQLHTGTAEAEIKPQVLEIALAHKLMSRFSSFVAVEQTPARPSDSALTSTAVANLLAKGQQPAAFPQAIQSSHTALAYPQTSLGINSLLLKGCCWLLLALLLAWRLKAVSRMKAVA